MKHAHPKQQQRLVGNLIFTYMQKVDLIPHFYLETLLHSHLLKKYCLICSNEIYLKMVKNAFLFHLKEIANLFSYRKKGFLFCMKIIITSPHIRKNASF